MQHKHHSIIQLFETLVLRFFVVIVIVIDS